MNNLEKTIATLGSLHRGELLELQAIIERLLAIDDTETTQTAPDGAGQGENKAGHIEYKMIPKKGKDGKLKAEYGPYKYLRYWQDGVHKSVYLGKISTPPG